MRLLIRKEPIRERRCLDVEHKLRPVMKAPMRPEKEMSIMRLQPHWAPNLA
jgi:hypothetical protein